MKRYSLAVLAIAFLSISPATAELHFEITPQIISSNAPRLGLNLGEWVAWGAAQFPSNVLKNSGFEGIIDRAIVVVKHADSSSFSDDSAWTKRPDGFWSGAGYEVRSGVSAGKRGIIFDSLATGSQALPQFKTEGAAPALQAGDIISLTRINDSELPTQWWFSKDLLPQQLSVELKDSPPNSLGVRSLALKPLSKKPVQVLSYLDAIGDRAGKLLPINGAWTLRFWLKQSEAGAILKASFKRLNGTPAFFEDAIKASPQWQRIERHFTAKDTGAAGTLELSLLAEGDSGRLLIDDISLSQDSNSDNRFRAELINTLKQLQPSYLRDWQGQLGDSFANRIAPPSARRASRYRSGQDSTYSYSLEEFLQLCKTVNAQPWLVVPTTLGDEELEQLGQYVDKQLKAFAFKEILLEFGNENWNAVFRPAGISDYRAHGLVASRAFELILKGANHNPAIRAIVGGQYVNPWLSAKVLENTANANALAIAPYFLFKLDAGDNPLEALFKQDDFYQETLAKTKVLNKELIVYEVNAHTTAGNASGDERDIATVSAASGSALAKRLLTGLNLGIKAQCLYTLAQYDAFFEPAQGKRELVKLWGIVRDLAQTGRLRPSGLVMQLLNELLPADIVALKNIGESDKDITISGFHNNAGWGLAVVSAKAESQTISVSLPPTAQQNWQLLQLSSQSPLLNNEEKENVTITEQALTAQNASIRFTLPAYGFVVLKAK